MAAPIMRAAKRISAVVAVLSLMAGQSCPGWQVNAEADTDHQPHDRSSHDPFHVDTKYWIRNTEFGERENWLNHLRPCTLAERIKMNEQSVVSMGTSMDAIGGTLLNASTINHLTLAQNGILLLEEDVPIDYTDSAFFDFLKLIGDCADGELTGGANDDTGQQHQAWPNSGGHEFEFEPDSDYMSWFNPDNWISSRYQHMEFWRPEAHQVPCGEDIVVFGGRHLFDAVERDKTTTFKLNFRPSEASQQTGGPQEGTKMVNMVEPLRVSGLVIGRRHYDQQEFDQLINSDDYRDILFQFNDSISALKQDFGLYSGGSSPLMIDETSLVRDSSNNFCLDEAGCLCGNERAEVMKVICSFHQPLVDDDLPCHDPISSAGYCNKVCATSLIISMDPSRFSERFLGSIIEKLMEDDSQDGPVYIGPRRIDDSKYEISFRYVMDGQPSSGIERDLAQRVLQQLERDSTRSFYGIRKITIKSSKQWRRNNRSLIFWLTATSLSLISVAMLARKNPDGSHDSDISANIGTRTWLADVWDQMRQNGDSLVTDSGSFARFSSQPTSSEKGSSDLHGSVSNIPLMEIDNDVTKDDHLIEQ